MIMKKFALYLLVLLLAATFTAEAAPASGALKKAGIIQEINLSDMLIIVDGELYAMDAHLTESLYEKQRKGKRFDPGQAVIIEYKWLNGQVINDSNKMVVDIKPAVKKDKK
jgi:hypothetical protein